MNFGARVEINFHQQSQVSVFLEVPAQEQIEVLSEATLIAALAIRVLSNMGKSDTSDQLAYALCTTNDTIREIVNGQPTGVEIIPYPGVAGRIVFTAHAKWVNSDFKTTVKSSGFDWVNTGYGYYGPTSVVTFLQYLVKKYHPQSPDELQQSKPLNAICGTCMVVGQYYLQGRISPLANHHQLAIDASQYSCSVAGIDWSAVEEPKLPLLPSPQTTGCLMIVLIWVASFSVAIVASVTLSIGS